MKLELSLQAAERREQIAYRVTVVSLVACLVLVFVGGSKMFGAFDPWSREANLFSVALGLIYVVATLVFPVSLASYYSRFRPRVRLVKEELRDAQIVELHREISLLREELASLRGKGEQQTH